MIDKVTIEMTPSESIMSLIDEYAVAYGRNVLSRFTRVNNEKYQLRVYELRDAIRDIVQHVPQFVPTAEPAPLDPVLVAIRDLYVQLIPEVPSRALPLDDLTCLMRHEWRKRTAYHCGEWDTDANIRAYGRDGAR